MPWLNSSIEEDRDWESPSATEMATTTSVDTIVAIASHTTAADLVEAVILRAARTEGVLLSEPQGASGVLI